MTVALASQSGVALFYSYSHVDEALRQELETHLALLRRQGVIREWHDRKLLPGTELDAAIDAELDRADVILLLVSPDFLASDYCYDREMMRALERHRLNQATVVPILIRPVDFMESPFAKLLALPTDAKPVTTWANRDEAWLSVAHGIRSVCVNRRSMQSTLSGEKVADPHAQTELEPQESDYGILDFNAELESAMDVVTECMNAMTSYGEELSAKLTAGTEESAKLRASAFPSKASRARQIATSMAAAMAAYAKKLDNTAAELHEAWDRVERYFPRIMASGAFATEAQLIPSLRTAMSTARDTLRGARESALGAKQSAAELGTFSGALKLGTGRAQTALQKVADECWRMEQSLEQLLSALDESVTEH